MAITHSTVSPHRSVDATGRALPMTTEEIRAQAVEIARGLDALDDMGDEEEQSQTLSALMKAIDEEPLSPRRRFRQ
jgi:broad specificity phosphatase PhoE